MEEKIKQIIEKVRSIGKYNTDMKELVRKNVRVTLVEIDSEFVIESISFYWYDAIEVTRYSIVLILEHGIRKVLFKYNDWDELLNM